MHSACTLCHTDLPLFHTPEPIPYSPHGSVLSYDAHLPSGTSVGSAGDHKFTHVDMSQACRWQDGHDVF